MNKKWEEAIKKIDKTIESIVLLDLNYYAYKVGIESESQFVASYIEINEKLNKYLCEGRSKECPPDFYMWEQLDWLKSQFKADRESHIWLENSSGSFHTALTDFDNNFYFLESYLEEEGFDEKEIDSLYDYASFKYREINFIGSERVVDLEKSFSGLNNKINKMEKYKETSPICSDEYLKEVAIDWCDLVNFPPTDELISAFTMGAKLAISNDGWSFMNSND